VTLNKYIMTEKDYISQDALVVLSAWERGRPRDPDRINGAAPVVSQVGQALPRTGSVGEDVVR